MNIPSSMPEQVSLAKELEISYRTLHPSAIIHDKKSDRNIRIPFSSLTNKYKDYLSPIIISIPLNEEEQQKYMFQPKTLSVDLYDTTEFWNDLLILNNCYSVINFKPKTIKLYDPKRFKTLLNEIMILESSIS